MKFDEIISDIAPRPPADDERHVLRKEPLGRQVWWAHP